MHFTLRTATTDDVADLQRIRHAVRENVLSSTTVITDAMVEEHLTRLGRGWVAEVGGRVVGFAIANRMDRSIWALFVDPDHERRGIGRALHDAMLAWLRAEGIEHVTLTTEPGTRADAFYRAAGWGDMGLDERGERRFARRP